LLRIYEEFEDTKGVIRIRKSKNNRQNNGRKKKTEQQTKQWPKEKVHRGTKQRSTKHETKYRVTRTPLKPGVNSCAPEV
jgi:hypothetical protein